MVVSKRDYYLHEQEASHVEYVVFPNIYPEEFKPKPRHGKLTFITVKTTHVDQEFVKALAAALEADTIAIGKKIAGAEYIPNVATRSEYLATLSQGHIGINYSNTGNYYSTGSNVKRYDYALAGLAVANHTLSTTGDPLLPCEFTFVNVYDLVAKAEAVLDRVDHCGRQNREYALKKYEEAYRELERKILELAGK